MLAKAHYAPFRPANLALKNGMSKIFKHLKRAKLKINACFHRAERCNTSGICGPHCKKPSFSPHLIYIIRSIPPTAIEAGVFRPTGVGKRINEGRKQRKERASNEIPPYAAEKTTCINEELPSRPANMGAIAPRLGKRFRRGGQSIRRARREANRQRAPQSSCSSPAAGASRRAPRIQAPAPSVQGCLCAC